MREIKFRRAYFLYKDDSFAGFSFWGVIDNGFTAPSSWSNAKGKIDQQYTGLKDKNGKEIYEGDILEIEGATANVVFWERPPEFGLDYYHNEDKWCEDWNLTDDSERMEIIGNIYENPELLKQ